MTVVASNYARRDNDLYQTEPWATEALLRHLPIGSLPNVWEPAAGNHLIADVLRECGTTVWTSDIITYDREHDMLFDFLVKDPYFGIPEPGAIVTNPPYGKGNRDAVRFAENALRATTGFVALLLTAKWDFGKTRVHLTRDNPRFRAKIALLDRIQWFPGNTTGTEDHAWYIWGPTGYRHPPARLFYEGRAPAGPPCPHPGIYDRGECCGGECLSMPSREWMRAKIESDPDLETEVRS